MSRAGRLAVLVPSLDGGGAERVVVNLLRGFAAADIPMDLVLVRPRGPLLSEVPDSVRIVPLRGGRIIASLPSLIRYLRRNRPVAMLSHLDTMNVLALVARRLSGVSVRTVVTTHVALSRHAPAVSGRQRIAARLARRLYPSADVVVGVSDGVARDLARHIRPRRADIRTIHNPIVTPEARERARTAHGAPNGEVAGPLVLSVGRMTPQKNHRLLLDAFARVAAERTDARLAILGDGRERPALERRAAELGIADRVELPGFVDPAPWYARASVFVLSSDWEGLPTVLIEALLFGCPIVSTRCPSGPEEILANGRYGSLVPPGDAPALAAAVLQSLASPPERELLRRRALDFDCEHAVEAYLDALYPEGVMR